MTQTPTLTETVTMPGRTMRIVSVLEKGMDREREKGGNDIEMKTLGNLEMTQLDLGRNGLRLGWLVRIVRKLARNVVIHGTSHLQIFSSTPYPRHGILLSFPVLDNPSL